MPEEIVNKVAKSGIITFDIADLQPKGERVSIDLKEVLFQGMVLRENDYREFLKSTDWEAYRDKHVAVYCSGDAIIPKWAWMQLASKLQSAGADVHFCAPDGLEAALFNNAIREVDASEYENAIVVVKGCGEIDIPASSYVEVTRKLQPVVRTLMFGEPCSTVPVYKKPKKGK